MSDLPTETSTAKQREVSAMVQSGKSFVPTATFESRGEEMAKMHRESLKQQKLSVKGNSASSSTSSSSTSTTIKEDSVLPPNDLFRKFTVDQKKTNLATSAISSPLSAQVKRQVSSKRDSGMSGVGGMSSYGSNADQMPITINIQSPSDIRGGNYSNAVSSPSAVQDGNGPPIYNNTNNHHDTNISSAHHSSAVNSPPTVSSLPPPNRPLNQILKTLVYYPHNNHISMEVDKSISALLLMEKTLHAIRRANGGKFPSNLSDAPSDYKLYAAEEDGEVDDEYPAIDDTMIAGNMGVEAFALVFKKGVAERFEGKGIASSSTSKIDGINHSEVELSDSGKGKGNQNHQNGNGNGSVRMSDVDQSSRRNASPFAILCCHFSLCRFFSHYDFCACCGKCLPQDLAEREVNPQ